MRRDSTPAPPARLSRRGLLAAAAALPAAGLLPGCSDDRRRRSSGGRITLRFQSLAWQQDSLRATRQLVDAWNGEHPEVQVQYVQGAWPTVHDQLLTSFEGGEAPDIIHDAADDLADFAYGGNLADLTALLPPRLRSDIPQHSWETATFDGRVHGVPFLQEPRVLIANRARLHRSGVRIPTPEHPWTWAEFKEVARRLTRGTGHGVAWPLKEPVSATLNLALSTGGRMFHRRPDGTVEVRFDAADQVVPRTIHDQVNVDRSASRTTLGMGGSDTLPGFFAGRYAMVPLGFSYRQQIAQQAPKRFDWTVLPAPQGAVPDQGVSPQTLSIAEDCPHKEAAMAFIDFLLRPPHMVRLALGDWLLPTGREALRDPALRVARYDWATGTALAGSLRSAPAQSVRGYPEWKDKVATPGLQEYYSGAIDLDTVQRRLVGDGNLVLARYQR
ncbi:MULTISPECIES: ABC transporter substrate-binding protein [unclassified Streptomyces]|uniref:ABC transporter substrate-binding protein n=1 Tax=unclassified Streptomyces TaxID=2593676 RepID=UPI0008814D5D|nr:MULTISPECIES: extracellular solute-binding protein [unclassified Streptomyces]PBC85672.1 carbohydrate ABC transporter substrate-binding protein (CUT1 family) [Streptomyces sp. 2321.6]SDR08974.1 carbohydrate ABC transporter substrate-binding protein, CUT1 family [Streptomyces sp. KS_16]SED75610.1 carbohydrate ABC transporter substrate-binding protein, CUT1 family [Streptomyces sp. 2133.1]SEE02661.1 carbohydrate ABC transporter substrate-binding protein, CUT1 family [Streptomyces sp. 2112.3]S